MSDIYRILRACWLFVVQLRFTWFGVFATRGSCRSLGPGRMADAKTAQLRGETQKPGRVVFAIENDFCLFAAAASSVGTVKVKVSMRAHAHTLTFLACSSM